MGPRHRAGLGMSENSDAIVVIVSEETGIISMAKNGVLIRRLLASQLTRPSADGVTHLYWDGRDADGEAVAPGEYTIAAETRVGATRLKATAQAAVGGE